jgi:hypothetical protein
LGPVASLFNPSLNVDTLPLFDVEQATDLVGVSTSQLSVSINPGIAQFPLVNRPNAFDDPQVVWMGALVDFKLITQDIHLSVSRCKLLPNFPQLLITLAEKVS